ncbi:MAG TPA: hypothetical protein VNJ29_03560 [Candidatus Nitrosotenuis sp.]|jgi:hypothetical protein|nr:hypothetical protein [Candidatus Nitrosotenuis sp.]
MRQALYGALLASIGIIPALSDTHVYVERHHFPSRSVVVLPSTPLTLLANNQYGQEVVVHQGPFTTSFMMVNPKGALPPTPAWDWVQFSMRFDLGAGIIKTACSAYGSGQDAASYDMLIPRHELPYHMKVLIRVHDFGGTPSYDCAVYPNLPVYRFRPRY